jgi:hypothetical protein
MKNIQTLKPIATFTEGYIKRNKNATLKTLYKNARDIESVSFIGDWPLIGQIINTCAEKNKFFEKDEVAKFFRSTNDPYLKTLRSDSELVAILTSKDGLIASIQAN